MYQEVYDKFIENTDLPRINLNFTDGVYPSPDKMFRAFEIGEVKVVILGQDPYHDGSAVGLAFSVEGDKIPPSLRNINKELESDVGVKDRYDLTCWKDQGVLLLNTALTVNEHMPGSHAKIWEPFTKAVIEKLGDDVVFILWGRHAQKYEPYIKSPYIIKSAS